MQEDTERRMEWKQVLESTIAVLNDQLALHPQTGLLADFLVYSVSEKRYKPAEGKLHLFHPSHPMVDSGVSLRHSVWSVKAFLSCSDCMVLFLKARSWRKTMMASMVGTLVGECQRTQYWMQCCFLLICGASAAMVHAKGSSCTI